MDPLPKKVVDVPPPKPPMKRDRQRLRRNHQVVALLVFWFSINFLISLFFQISGPNHPPDYSFTDRWESLHRKSS